MTLRPTFEHYYPDGSKGGECGIFAHNLVEFPHVGDTITTKTATVIKYGTLGKNCQIGDVLILNVGTTAGHVTIVNDDKGLYWQLTESNWSNNGLVHHTRLLLKTSPQIVGFFRGALKVAIINNPMTKKVLVLFSQIDALNIIEMKQGIQKYVDLVRVRTNNEFEIEISYAEINRAFHTERNGTVVYVVPSEIGEEGHKVEVSTGKEFDTVCLIYNNTTVIGELPTNPVENPVIIEGFNPIQIPLNWLGEGDTVLSTSIFFSHENCHSDYQIINTEGGLSLFDKTHDVYEQTPTYGPLERFSDLLIELKPYWKYLSNSTTAQGEPMVYFKVKGKPAIYEFVHESWRGYDDPTSYSKDTAGKVVKIVELDQAEFDKLPQLFPI